LLIPIPVAVFEPTDLPNYWQPLALAAGPFAGLQGGAVASLLTAEVEAMAGERKCGSAVSVTAWFLRRPMAVLRTRLGVLSEGGRVSVIDNTLWPENEDQPCAMVRRTGSRGAGLCRERDRNQRSPQFTRYAVARPRTVGHGSWMRWRRASAKTLRGFD